MRLARGIYVLFPETTGRTLEVTQIFDGPEVMGHVPAMMGQKVMDEYVEEAQGG